MALPSKQRDFTPRTVRSGNGVRYIFPIHCSKCGWDFDFEHPTNFPDQVINKKLQRLGWLLGKNRRDDMCPRCVGVSPENRLANKFRVISSDNKPVETPKEKAHAAAQELFKRDQETSNVLARHFPSPTSEEPEEDTRDMAQAPTNFVIQQGLSLQQTLELSSALTGIHESMKAQTKELGNLSAALELLTSTMDRVATQNAQMSSAIGMVVPALVRQTEGITGQMDRLSDHITGAVDGLKEALEDFIAKGFQTPPATVPVIPTATPPAPVVPPNPPEGYTREEAAEEFTKIAESIIGNTDKTPSIDNALLEHIQRKRGLPAPTRPKPNTKVLPDITFTTISPKYPTSPRKPMIRISRKLWTSLGFNVGGKPVVMDRIGDDTLRIRKPREKETGIALKTANSQSVVVAGAGSLLVGMDYAKGFDTDTDTKNGSILLRLKK